MYYIKKKKTSAKVKPKARKPSKSSLVAKLDKVFSMYIRLRDSRQYGFKFFRCISCGRILPFEQCDAGHYFSRRNMSIRFSENNVHGECRHCNRFSADHLIGFERNLRKKIGDKEMSRLYIQAHQIKKWSDFELQEMIKYYQNLINVLKQ